MQHVKFIIFYKLQRVLFMNEHRNYCAEVYARAHIYIYIYITYKTHDSKKRDERGEAEEFLPNYRSLNETTLGARRY